MVRRQTIFALSLAVAGACRSGGGAQPAVPPAGAEPIAPVAGPVAPPAAATATAAPVAGAAATGAVGNLLVDGAPPVPDEVVARLARYLDMRSASVTDLSDDGKAMLIKTRFGDSSQVHRIAMPGGARMQLTFGREPSTGGLFAPGSSRSLLYTSDVGGNEQYQLYRLDLNGYRTTRLTDGKSRNTGAIWSDDGKKLAWASTARDGRDFDIWTSDGVRPESAALGFEVVGDWSPMDFSADGKKLLLLEFISINLSKVHLADLASRKLTQVSPPAPPASYRDAALAPDGKRAYVTSDKDGEFVQLYEVDLARKSWRSLTSKIPWNVEEIELSHDGAHLAFVVDEGGYSRLHLLDTRTRVEHAVVAIPAGQVSGLVFARRAPVLGFTLAGATRTGDAYTYSLRTRKIARWTESEMGGLDPAGFVEPTVIQYKSFDGAQIPAFYYRPKGAGPFPVVIEIHGGPEAQVQPIFNPLTQILLAEGIACIEPNVRGSDGYGKTYLKLDDGPRREDSVKDIGALLDWVAAQKELDARRVAVFGGSYGGYMVLASLVHFGDRLAAGIDMVGISNFVTFLTNTSEYRRDLRRVEYGDERDPKMRALLQEISPVHHADRIQSALFVAQGANDPRVPASEAEQIVKAVRRNGRDVWYLLARDEGHGFAKKENKDVFLELTILFLEKHLLGR